ncbi:MAG: LysE family translocator [Pseudomonadota bacterium]
MTLILIAIALAVLTPGPANMAIMATAMARGRLSGIMFALGVQSGSAIWALLAAIGLSTWLEATAYGLTAMKILGGLYLLWLGFKSLRSALTAHMPEAATVGDVSFKKLFIRGALLHLTNPKAILSWLAVVALIKGTADAPFWLTITACILVSGVIFQAYAVIFGNPMMVRVYKRARRSIEAALALVFGYAGGRLLLSA